MSAGGAHHRRRPTLALLLTGLVMLLVLATSAPSGDTARPVKGEDDGIDLLRRAAEASRVTAYDGVQSVAVRSAGALATEQAEVRHRPSEGTGHADAVARNIVVGRSLVVDPDPSTRLDERVLEILENNYRVVRAGSGTAAGRTAEVVEARRGDSSVAGRFWVDERTLLPLRRDVLDAMGEVTHSVRFVTLTVGGGTGTLPVASGETDHWRNTLSPRERTRLEKRGWPMPERLSWNLPLVDARSKRVADGRVVHLSYSDGLSTVSVFVQRGRLGPESVGTTSGMRPVVEGGGTIYVDDSGQSRRMWESGGFVYTVLADAPPEMTGTVVEALPDPDGSGFWERVWRGFERLGSRASDVAGFRTVRVNVQK